jgi:aryl-alcohol dehydrogenase-like predicted oxidoreductase
MSTGRFMSPDDFEDGDFRKISPRFSAENFPKNLELADKLHAIAARKGVTTSQLALAWLLAQGDNVIPIPGTKSIKYYDENMGSLSVKLSDVENLEIREAVEKADVTGSRYPTSWAQTSLFADTVPLR